MKPEKPWLASTLLWGCLLCLLCATTPAESALLDFLFGKKPGDAEAAHLDPKQRSWRVGEFTNVQLVPREPGAPANQHPAPWSPEKLREQLAPVRADLRGGAQPLFAADELGALVGPLSQAFALAGPDDDVLLLSTHRRDGGILIAPFGVTARLFVQDGSLQLIVHDARLDFMDAYIGTRVAPTFKYGSRTKPGNAVLQSAAATSRRADWLSIPAQAASAGAVVPPIAAPAPPVLQPVAAAVPAAAPAMPVATPKAPPATPAPRPRDPGFAEEIEQRLLTLKRLLDKGLISEAEYQQMRKDVLQLL